MKIVFIVDDNETNLMSVKLALEGRYKTYAMTSAARMFKMLDKIIPDLILLDVNMPEMDGLEALRILKKEDSETEFIRVILLTARDDMQTISKGISAGAVDYITKPFEPDVLLRRVNMFTM